MAPALTSYAASKTGVIGLSHSLQFEAKKRKFDIKCNMLLLQVGTRMTEDFANYINESHIAASKKNSHQRSRGNNEMLVSG
jgi:NAD(P)-dependent dehydrogenase (short-subunit alcohol dehydrogenase family)